MLRLGLLALLASATFVGGSAGGIADGRLVPETAPAALENPAGLDAPAVLAAVREVGDPSQEAERVVRQSRLAQQLEGLPGEVSVALLDVESGAEIVVGDTVVEAASTIKVDILATLLLSEEGSLGRQDRRLARSMIRVSDNSATDVMLADVGRRAVNRFGRAAGLATTSVRNTEWGETRTTAMDRLRVLRATLGDNSLLDRRGQAYLRGLMEGVTREQRIGVDAAADRPRAAPLKAGYKPDDATGRWYVSSMGEVQTDGRTYLLAVVSSGHRSLERGEKVVDRASRLTVAAAARLAEDSP